MRLSTQELPNGATGCHSASIINPIWGKTATSLVHVEAAWLHILTATKD